jgi:regulator of cell morphogenesis and NO signaling
MMVANSILRVGDLDNYGLDFAFQSTIKKKIAFEDRNRYHLWELPFLCEYIVNNHHQYVEASIPAIRGYLKQAVWDHAERYPELREAAKLFFSLSEMLLAHMRNERCVLFPLVTKMYRANTTNAELPETANNTVSILIANMTAEHDAAEAAMAKIRELLKDYSILESSGLQRTYGALVEFERDLHRQTFIENEVLFPAAQDLEREYILTDVAA